ncbi:MAG: metallo-mystery pair system four-Cys motif protein [Vitreoscilla sp.]|nr:metallo-mystery pair system four-Cys motif protein [Vitreoscilla sp.]
MKNLTLTRSILTTAAIASLAAMSACGGGEEDTTPRAVTLNFDIVAGTTPVRCGTAVSGLGTGAVAAQPKDLRYYVSAVKFIKADGTEVPLTLGNNDDWNLTVGNDSVSLIDLEDATGSCPTATGTAATNAKITGTVLGGAGAYTGVKFEMGVPFALNHSLYSSATKPLDLAAMAWSWQSGRKFAKVEVTDPAGATGTWTAKTFNFHLGSTGCTGNPANGETVACTVPNRAVVKLASFNATTQKIALDVKTLLAGEDVTVNAAGAAGCMSGGTDPECDTVFTAMDLGWNAAGTGTGLPLSGGASQTVFKALAQ